MNWSATLVRAAGILGTLLIPIIAAAQIPHEGVWTTIDRNDGSRAFVAVNAEWQIVFYDTNATFGCREGGGGPFIGFDENNGNTVRLEGHVLVGYIDGACQNGGKNQNTSFDFGMGYFPEFDTIRSRGTDWDRTYLDPETFVANAFELKKLPEGAWEFLGSYGGDDPQIIPGVDCSEPYVIELDEQIILHLTSDLDLRACKLLVPEISGAGFGINLRESDLAGGSNGEGQFLRDSDFSGARLTSFKFKDTTYLLNNNFQFADLSFAVFEESVEFFLNPILIEGGNFKGANLRGIRISQYFGAPVVIWNGNIFDGANLEGADFNGMSVRSFASFINANMKSLRFDAETFDPDAIYRFGNTICPDGTNSDDNGGFCSLVAVE